MEEPGESLHPTYSGARKTQPSPTLNGTMEATTPKIVLIIINALLSKKENLELKARIIHPCFHFRPLRVVVVSCYSFSLFPIKTNLSIFQNYSKNG